MHNNVYPRYHFGRENYYIPGNLWYSTLFKLTEVWKFAVFAIQLQQHTTCLCSRIVLLRDICFLFLLLLCLNSNAKEEFRQYLIIKPNILSPVLNSLQVFQSSINLGKLAGNTLNQHVIWMVYKYWKPSIQYKINHEWKHI